MDLLLVASDSDPSILHPLNSEARPWEDSRHRLSEVSTKPTLDIHEDS